MSRVGPSVRIATGIFKTRTHYRVTTSFRKHQVERRYPLSAGLREMKDWQIAEKERLKYGRVIFTGSAGTLSGDVKRYLAQSKHLASWKSRRSELHAWTATDYGGWDRQQITAEQVRIVVGQWLARGVKPKTVRNRLVALASLYHLLDGPDAPSPSDAVSVAVPRTRPAYVPVSVPVAVEANLRAHEAAGRLRDAKTRGRFMVMAATGIRPSQLMRVQPHEVDLVRRVWTVAGGKGGEPITLWLNEDMMAAWRVFVEAKAWGPYDTRSMARTLRTAGWPAGIRPYNVRHAVGQDLSEQGEDLQDIADWMGHRDVATTRAYYVPILTSRMRAMSERMDGRLGWGQKVGPEPAAPEGSKRPKTARFQTRPVQQKRAASRRKTAR